MEKGRKLNELFDLAKKNGVVHNQVQFAELLQTDASTMSVCLKGGNKKYDTTVRTLVSRAELALMKAGITIDNDNPIQHSVIGRSNIENVRAELALMKAGVSSDETIEDQIKERACLLLKELDINQNTLQQNEKIIYNQLTGESKLDMDVIMSILDMFPNISADWLLRGIGSKTHTNIYNPPAPSQHPLNTLSMGNEGYVAQLRDTVVRQQREIDGLYDRINELKKIIENLKKENAGTTTVHTA